MNFLGHTFVALAGGDDPEYLLGAVLPDLASMARIRLARNGDGLDADGELARGIRCHIEVDAAFHARPEFRQGMAAIRTGLSSHDIGRGPARAIAHVGWELVLDGTLLGTPTEAAYWRALDVAPRALDAVLAPDRERWTSFVDRWFTTPRPRLHYDDPEWVAERLYLMLSDRPHLRFPMALVPAVAWVLDDQRAAIAAGAEDLLASLAAAGTPS